MNNHSIIAKITGVAGNTATATLEVSTDFYPIVRVAIFSSNPENITRNLIFEVFQESDEFVERCKPFIEKMESDCLKEEENYFIPYLRMWPPQEGEHIFTLACIVNSGKDNCTDQGDIYVEMPIKVSGLKINNIPNGVIKDVYTYSTVPLELSLTSNADRTLTDIKEVPLIFYVMNNGERTEVGRVHLSVAPYDVFSKSGIDRYLDKFKEVQDRIEDSQNYCLPAFREALEALLCVKANDANERNKQYKKQFSVRTKNYDNYVMHTYCNALSDVGIAQHFFTTSYHLNSAKTLFKQSGRTYEETLLPTTMVASVSEKCVSEVKEQLGYHLFGVSLIYGSHVMSLVADHSKLNNIEFILSDHHLNGTNTYRSDSIDKALDKHSIGAWKYYFATIGRGLKKPNSKLDLWKIQNS